MFVFSFDIYNVTDDDMRLWGDCQITFCEERMMINYFGCLFVYLAYTYSYLWFILSSADVNCCWVINNFFLRIIHFNSYIGFAKWLDSLCMKVAEYTYFNSSKWWLFLLSVILKKKLLKMVIMNMKEMSFGW